MEIISCLKNLICQLEEISLRIPQVLVLQLFLIIFNLVILASLVSFLFIGCFYSSLLVIEVINFLIELFGIIIQLNPNPNTKKLF